MEVSPAFAVVLFVAMAFVVGLFWIVRSTNRQSALRALAGLFDPGATVDDASSSVRGELAGLIVVYRLTTRGSGSSAVPWTDVDVVHGVSPLELALRPHTPTENRNITKGQAVDLETGHAAFDARFVVEAAPKELVLGALDADVCRALAALEGAADVRTPRPRELRLSRRGWITDLARARKTIDVAVSLATRLRAAQSELERASVGAGAYRDGPGDGAAEDERQAEVAALRALQGERAARQARRSKIFGLVVLGLFFVLLAVKLLGYG